MTLYEKVYNALTDLDDDSVISLWNEYCYSNHHYDDVVYYNNEDFFKGEFNDPWEAIERTFYGHWEHNDPYVCFNGYANLDSFYDLDDEYSPINYGELAKFVIDNELFDKVDLDEDDLEESESEDE